MKTDSFLMKQNCLSWAFWNKKANWTPCWHVCSRPKTVPGSCYAVNPHSMEYFSENPLFFKIIPVNQCSHEQAELIHRMK